MGEDMLCGVSDTTRYTAQLEGDRVVVRWSVNPLDFWSLGHEQAKSLLSALESAIGGPEA